MDREDRLAFVSVATRALHPCLSSRPVPRASTRAKRGPCVTTKEGERGVLKKKKTRKEIRRNERRFSRRESIHDSIRMQTKGTKTFARGTGGGTFAPGRNSQGTCPRHHGHLVARHGSVSRPWLPRNTQGPREASRHRAGSQRPSRTTQRRFACSRPGRQQHHHMATCDRDLLGNVPRLPGLPDGQRTQSMLRHLGAKRGASRAATLFLTGVEEARSL